MGDCPPKVPVWKRFYNALSALFCCVLPTGEKRPTSEIVVQDTKLHALFDTGAQCTCASYEWYSSLPNNKKPQLVPYNNKLTAANGQEMRCRGIARLHFKLKDYQFSHEVVILDGLRTPMIVGVDLMKRHGLVIDVAQRKIYRSPSSTHENVSTKPGALAPRNITLEPLQAMMIEVDNPLDGPVGQKYVVNGYHVPLGVTDKNSQGKSVFLLANKQLIPVQIKRGERICYFEKVDDDDMINNEQLIAEIENDILKRGGGNTVNNTVKTLSDQDINKAIIEVPNEHKSKFRSLLKAFSDIFSIDPNTIGRCDILKQKITLIDKNRVACTNPYKIAPNLLHIVESYVHQLLKQDVIENSTSCFNSPILLVKKPGKVKTNDLMSNFRVCHDFRKLNMNTLKVTYPLNFVFDLVDRVAGGSVLSVLDISSGYFNQLLEENSKKYTAFSVPGIGHFQYKRCAQGLKNSGSYFQKMLHMIVAGIPDVFVFVDDILISSKDMQTHLVTLEKVFERFRKYGLKCRVSKVKFGAKSVEYLGWHITANTAIRPGDLKTKAIREYVEPTSMKSLRGFLGLCNFFRRCLPFYSQLAKPLTALTRKDSAWQGGPLPAEARQSFLKLRKLLASKPALKPIDFTKDFHIQIDSSLTGTGVVVYQIHDGIKYPNLYLSRSTDCSKRRSAWEIESGGLLWALRSLRSLVLGSHCIIEIDHRPLASLCRTSTTLLDRVYAELEEYSYEIKYVPGKSIISDGLSRQEDHSKCKLCKGSVAEQTKDSSCVTSINMLNDTLSDGCPERMHVLDLSTCAARRPAHEQAADLPPNRPTRPNQFISDAQLPSSKEPPNESGVITISSEQIVAMQKTDYYVKALLVYMKYGKLPDKPEFRQWVLKMFPRATIRNGIVGSMHEGRFKILAPLNLRETLLHLAHDHPLSGHFNHVKTKYKLVDWTWDGMDRDIQEYVYNCRTCQLNNPPRGGYTKMKMGQLPDCHKMNDRVHADLLGPLPVPLDGKYKYLLIMVDSYSSFMRVEPLEDKTAQSVAKGLYRGWVCHFSTPLHITCDAGSEFNSGAFKELCKILGTELNMSSIEHPMSNGAAERQVRNVISYIRKFVGENPATWPTLTDGLMSALNTSLHTDKLRTPHELVFGYPPIHAANYQVRKYDYSDGGLSQLVRRHFELFLKVKEFKQQAYDRHKIQYEKNLNEHKFPVNSIVYLKAKSRQMKLNSPWVGPLRVTSVDHNDNVTMVHILNGKIYKAHLNRVKLGTYSQNSHLLPAHHKEALCNPFPKPDVQNTAQKETPRDLNVEVEQNLRRSLRQGPQSAPLVTTPSLQNYEPSHWPTEAHGNQATNTNAPSNVQNDTDANLASDAKNVQHDTSTFQGPLTRSRARMLAGANFDQVLQVINCWQQGRRYDAKFIHNNGASCNAPRPECISFKNATCDAPRNVSRA